MIWRIYPVSPCRIDPGSAWVNIVNNLTLNEFAFTITECVATSFGDQFPEYIPPLHTCGNKKDHLSEKCILFFD